MNSHQANVRTSNRTLRLKESLIASFCESGPAVAARLKEFSAGDWQKIQFWLDARGIALYFLNRLTTLKLQHLVPETLLARLQENLANNRERTSKLFEEAVSINHALQQKSIQFALLKGATLFPDSVPDSTFRTQWDLDFLVAEKDAEAALTILKYFGYALYAISGTTWELRAGVSGVADIANIYKVRPYRSLELHLLSTQNDDMGKARQDQVTRARTRNIRGEALRSLSPSDLFMQQALHLFKHICGEYTRASWVLEYWRHVLARRNDAAFWQEVRSLADDEPQADIAIGTVTLLATHLFGEFAPPELTCWSMN